MTTGLLNPGIAPQQQGQGLLGGGLAYNPLLSLGAGLLGSSGPSLMPVGLGQGLSQGLLRMQQGARQQQEAARKQALLELRERGVNLDERRFTSDEDQRGLDNTFRQQGFDRQGEWRGQDVDFRQQGFDALQTQREAQNALNQQRFSFDQNQAATANARADQGLLLRMAAFDAKMNPKAKVTDVAGLRKEFQAESKGFSEVVSNYKKMEAAADTGPGDIAMITTYMKTLDPGSVVREGEFATAQNSAGIPEAIRAMYNRAISGERLTPGQRQNFLAQGRALVEAGVPAQTQREQDYRAIAERQNMDPANVVRDLLGQWRPKEGGQAPIRVGSATQGLLPRAPVGVDLGTADLGMQLPGLTR